MNDKSKILNLNGGTHEITDMPVIEEIPANGNSGMKSTALKYRHLFFDLDHTLWDFESNARESLIELYKIFELDRKLIMQFEEFYTTYSKHNTILWDRYQKGYVTSDDLKWKRMWQR